ncbi:MAG: LysR family transcriptional regulator [Eubacteriales bacterium]|nr:LysR family transcriptional regulator [Eubacteriales bacterium]
MELRHIRYFLAVAEEMNFTRAAEKCSIAQPPLSRQIKELEQELGVTLFIRKPHNLQLTEEGQLFYQYAHRVIDLVNRSVEDVQDIQSGLHGTIYLGLVEGHAPRMAAKWISVFHKLHPHVQFNLWNGNSDDVMRRMRKGLCELGVVVEPFNEEGFESIPVYQEPWIAMIPAECPLAKEPGDTVDFQKILDYELIIPSKESRLDEISSWVQDTTRHLKIVCRNVHMLNAYELTRNNVGITVYPASANIGIDDSVVIKKLTNPSVSATYRLVWSEKHHLSHVNEVFLDFIRQNSEAVSL